MSNSKVKGSVVVNMGQSSGSRKHSHAADNLNIIKRWVKTLKTKIKII